MFIVDFSGKWVLAAVTVCKGAPVLAQPAANNVLSKLDGQKPSAFYWQLTILATLGGFLFGYDTSNIGLPSTSCPTT